MLIENTFFKWLLHSISVYENMMSESIVLSDSFEDDEGIVLSNDN